MLPSGKAPPRLNWSLMLVATASIHPGSGLRVLMKRTQLLGQLAWAWPHLTRWMERDPSGLLREQIEADPQRLGVLVWPYIHAGWTADRRIAVQAEHFRLVQQYHPWLALGVGERRAVLSLDSLTPGLGLELDRAYWFQREGELVFNLFLHDHRLMSVAFTFALEQANLIAYVGGIQGSNRPEALDIYRELTKTMNGLRPRDFVVKCFQMFARALGVTRVLCVADEYRHQRHPYFGTGVRPALRLDYDEVWRENGAQRLTSGFFQLAVTPAARPPEEVPVRKRAMYRRRLQMVAELDLALQRELRACAEPADQSSGLRTFDPAGGTSPEAA
jgi:uncharacterized protein VirK/YbjX